MNFCGARDYRDVAPTVLSHTSQCRIVAQLQAEVDALKRLQAETAAELDASLYRQSSYLPGRVIPHSHEPALD